jgi:mRNA-degrading endonuclease YafQ of YafQ-DinJ toxin-antitoxin module
VRALIWSPNFTRTLRRKVRQNPLLNQSVGTTIRQLAADPFHPSLHSHKLKGSLSGVWACTVDYDNRILFEFVVDPSSEENAIHLLALGTHDEVY